MPEIRFEVWLGDYDSSLAGVFNTRKEAEDCAALFIERATMDHELLADKTWESLSYCTDTPTIVERQIGVVSLYQGSDIVGCFCAQDLDWDIRERLEEENIEYSPRYISTWLPYSVEEYEKNEDTSMKPRAYGNTREESLEKLKRIVLTMQATNNNNITT